MLADAVKLIVPVFRRVHRVTAWYCPCPTLWQGLCLAHAGEYEEMLTGTAVERGLM